MLASIDVVMILTGLLIMFVIGSEFMAHHVKSYADPVFEEDKMSKGDILSLQIFFRFSALFLTAVSTYGVMYAINIAV
jgi:hypothetical protein